jgi:hypothetical protein
LLSPSSRFYEPWALRRLYEPEAITPILQVLLTSAIDKEVDDCHLPTVVIYTRLSLNRIRNTPPSKLEEVI